MTSWITSLTASQPEAASGCATAEAAATSGPVLYVPAVALPETPPAATTAAAVVPAQDKEFSDSLEVQVDVNSEFTSPEAGTSQQQQVVPEAYMDDLPWECRYRNVEWREGHRRFGIPCLPTYLAPKEEVEEVPLHELTPVGRKFYTPIRTQCCSGAGFHLYRTKWCICRSRFCFSD